MKGATPVSCLAMRGSDLIRNDMKRLVMSRRRDEVPEAVSDWGRAKSRRFALRLHTAGICSVTGTLTGIEDCTGSQ